MERGQDWTPRRQDRGRQAARLTAVNLLGSGITEAQRRKATHFPAPSSNVEEFRRSMEQRETGENPQKEQAKSKAGPFGCIVFEGREEGATLWELPWGIWKPKGGIMGARQFTGFT